MDDSYFVGTTKGIFTVRGIWYRVDENDLRNYAGKVLQFESISKLLSRSDTWLKLPETISIWIAPLLIWQFGIGIAPLVAIVLYCLIRLCVPILVGHYAYEVVKLISNVFIQALLYVVILSYWGQTGAYSHLGMGIFIFALVRWGALHAMLNPLLKKIQKRIYSISLEDKVLKAVIVRAGLKHRVALPEIERIESSVLRKWNS